MNITKYNQDNSELYINQDTGETFTSISGYARMSDRSKSTIHERLDRLDKTGSEDSEIKLEVPTEQGSRIIRVLKQDTH